MICAACHGTGRRSLASSLPCRECEGTGIVSCCEGACGRSGEVVNGELSGSSAAIQAELARVFGGNSR